MCFLTTEEVNSTSEVSVNVTVDVANQFYPFSSPCGHFINSTSEVSVNITVGITKRFPSFMSL